MGTATSPCIPSVRRRKLSMVVKRRREWPQATSAARPGARPPSLSSPFSSQCTSTSLCLTASPSGPLRSREGTCPSGRSGRELLTGCPFWCLGALDGQAVSPFPFVLFFSGAAILNPCLRCRRWAEVNWMQTVHYSTCLSKCSCGVVWHDVWIESCDEPFAFHIKDAPSRLSGIPRICWGRAILHLRSVMPDWHDLDICPMVEVGELGAARDTIRTQRGVTRYVIIPPSPPQLPFARLAELPTSLSRFP